MAAADEGTVSQITVPQLAYGIECYSKCLNM